MLRWRQTAFLAKRNTQMNASIQAIILAAGMSSRFGGESNKLLTPVCGTPMVAHVFQKLQHLNMPITVVIGHQKEQIKNTIKKYSTKSLTTFVIQDQQKGSGHAVACTKPKWQADNILILNGDMPLVTTEIISALCTLHTDTQATASIVTSFPDTLNHAYGRVVEKDGKTAIIEAKDFTGDKHVKYPINAGIYIFNRQFLDQSLNKLTADNASKELYLTDLIGMASAQKDVVATYQVPFDFVRGVNTPTEFAQIAKLAQKNIVHHWMKQGVLCYDPDTTYIDDTVTLKKGVILHPSVHLRGNTSVDHNAVIDSYTIIDNSVIGHHANIGPHCVLSNAYIASHQQLQPYTYKNGLHKPMAQLLQPINQ